MSGDTPTRKAERIDILGELSGEVMVYQPITITQIASAGAEVSTTFALQLDSLHEFRLMLGDRSVVVKGRIVHARVADVEDGGVVYRAGIEFVEPSEHVLQAVAEFIETVRASRMTT